MTASVPAPNVETAESVAEKQFQIPLGPISESNARYLMTNGCGSEPDGCTHVMVRDVVLGPWRAATTADLAAEVSS